MLPTPSTSHVNFDHIYEPAEDSYLLLDTLSSQTEIHFLRKQFPPIHTPPPLVLEVGTGSGVVMSFVTVHAKELFGRHDLLTLGTDLNSFACKATAETVRVALADIEKSTTDDEPDVATGMFLGGIMADLASCVQPGSVDVLICNPPYVPSESPPAVKAEFQTDDTSLGSSARFERDSYLLSLSYAGGLDGMEMTNRLLEQLPSILSNRGVAYLLLCARNKPEATAARIREWSDRWRVETVGDSGKKAGWEKLCVLRIWREES